MISNDVLEHVNKCLKEVKEQRKFSTKGYNYTNLEIATFMSILFNEKYTEEDIHALCVATIRKIRKMLHTNRELNSSLLDDLSNCKSSIPDYSYRFLNLAFERNFFGL